MGDKGDIDRGDGLLLVSISPRGFQRRRLGETVSISPRGYRQRRWSLTVSISPRGYRQRRWGLDGFDFAERIYTENMHGGGFDFDGLQLWRLNRRRARNKNTSFPSSNRTPTHFLSPTP
ncbi:hypothetical protein F2Q69_00060314 [Brassica cretica]|uniref:Uncharacterized protein n=1 Tax=Brassica cretica TaxID=69181 RepID=A0A8S9RE84_BRACR|nr:hypothetical protein F2Q69_00060314 [Brassica cretica]